MHKLTAKPAPLRSSHRPFTKRAVLLVALLLFVCLGVYILGISKAATPTFSYEPENGTITKPATKQSDSTGTTSGGSYIAFGPDTTTRSAPVKLMPLGDSITNGFQYQPSYGGYRIVLWQKLVRDDHDNIDFVGSGQSGPATLGDRDMEGHDGWTINGTPSTALVTHIDAWLATYRPDIILLHAGTNDLNLNTSGPDTSTRLDTLLGKIYTDLPNVKVVVAQIIRINTSYPPQITAQNEYHDAIPMLAAKYQAQGRNIQVIDMSNLLLFSADYADTLHPNNQGYDKMGAAWYSVVSALYKTF